MIPHRVLACTVGKRMEGGGGEEHSRLAGFHLPQPCRYVSERVPHHALRETGEERGPRDDNLGVQAERGFLYGGAEDVAVPGSVRERAETKPPVEAWGGETGGVASADTAPKERRGGQQPNDRLIEDAFIPRHMTCFIDAWTLYTVAQESK